MLISDVILYAYVHESIVRKRCGHKLLHFNISKDRTNIEIINNFSLSTLELISHVIRKTINQILTVSVITKRTQKSILELVLVSFYCKTEEKIHKRKELKAFLHIHGNSDRYVLCPVLVSF